MLEYKKFNHDGSLEFDCPVAGDYGVNFIETTAETEASDTRTVPVFSSETYGTAENVNGLLQLVDIAYDNVESGTFEPLGYSALSQISDNEWKSRGFYDLDVSITGENKDQFKVTVRSTYLHGIAGFLDLPLICTYCLFVYDNKANIIGRYVFSIRVTAKT
jgi:hypothetical protein